LLCGLFEFFFQINICSFTCDKVVRFPDEHREELCEAKSQEGARELRRISTDRRSLP
jgi:hypothetical protein